jgi:hypothetical protein
MLRRGRCRFLPDFVRSGRGLEVGYQPIRFRKKLLDVMKTRPTRGAGAEVGLNLLYLGELELAIE